MGHWRATVRRDWARKDTLTAFVKLLFSDWAHLERVDGMQLGEKLTDVAVGSRLLRAREEHPELFNADR